MPTARSQPGSLEGGDDSGVISLTGRAGGSRVRIRGKYETRRRGVLRIEMICTVTADMGHGTRIWYTLPGSVMCAIKQCDVHKLHTVGDFPATDYKFLRLFVIKLSFK